MILKDLLSVTEYTNEVSIIKSDKQIFEGTVIELYKNKKSLGLTFKEHILKLSNGNLQLFIELVS